MADNTTVKDAADASVAIATDDVSGVQFQKVKLDLGGDGVSVPVSGSVPVSDNGGSLTVDGTVGVSGTVTVTGPLTDTQLRATAVPVSGTVTATGPLTDTQLRATAVPVSLASAPLPTGAATAANQTTGNTSLSSIDGKLPALVASKVPVQTDERPSASAVAITPSDSTNFAGGVCRGIYVGGAGTVVAIVNATAVTFAGCVAGSILPVQATRVNATSTTATNLVALY